jgi:hypothetical protein
MRRKVFFSEEKKQKTFVFLDVGAACMVREASQKSFASFLQKRRPSFLFGNLTP